MIGTRNTRYKVILQMRDRRILSLLESLRAATKQQIAAVCGFDSDTRANARLSQLIRAKYLARDFIGTIRGGRLAVYFLPGRRPKARRGPAGFEAAVMHELEIGEVYLALKRAAENQGWRFSWNRPAAPLGQSAAIPDALIQLEALGERKTFLLEHDRATEGMRIWKEKVAKYLDLARSQGLLQLLGSERFAVLVVVPSEKRLAQIRAAIAVQTGKIFWISTVQAINRDGFLAPVWLRPEGGQRLSLLGGT